MLPPRDGGHRRPNLCSGPLHLNPPEEGGLPAAPRSHAEGTQKRPVPRPRYSPSLSPGHLAHSCLSSLLILLCGLWDLGDMRYGLWLLPT